MLLYMSSKKSPIVEKSVEHPVSPIRDVLVVPPGAVGATGSSDDESMHTHPALLVEQRTSQNTSPSPIVTSSASTANSNRTGIVAVKQSNKSEKEKAVPVSPKTRREGKRKVKGRGKGNRKKTRHAGGGSGTRKKYNRKLRTTRGRKR